MLKQFSVRRMNPALKPTKGRATIVVSPPRSRSISLAARRGRKEDVTRVVSVTERFSACPQLKDLKAGSLAELCDILLTLESVDMHHRSGLDRQRNHRPCSGPDHSRNFAKGRLDGWDVLKDLRGNEQVRPPAVFGPIGGAAA